MCTEKEWGDFEPRMLSILEKARDAERLKIHMFRKEYDKALSLLKKSRYPDLQYGGNEILKIAEELEKMYPEKILSFYMTGLGNLNRSLDRRTYARRALVMAKVRHIWVDVMKTPETWEKFGYEVKEMNRKRPAFQEEFTKALPDWKAL